MGKPNKRVFPVCNDSMVPSVYRRLSCHTFDQIEFRKKALEKLFQSLYLGPEDRARMANLEQGSEEWLEARRNRLTGSNFGAAVGHNKFKSPLQLAHEMLYENFEGNEATRWGNAHEQVACHEYILAKKQLLCTGGNEDDVDFSVSHSGLNPHESKHWLAVSPDGHVRENGVTAILEIKCPFKRKLYPEIPPYYMDQIQGIMGVLSVPWTDFCVWTPDEFSIQRVAFNKEYWESRLYPGLERFYHEVFIPAYLDREESRAMGDESIPPYPS